MKSVSNLPPNPYQRSPIKKREDLAGRDQELKTIRYYLTLTASGQSPHLALIGQRGVGKTSLLNGAEAIAKELRLLPVRLDMNEQKANSQWIFWRDLYQTLILAMVNAGCWGGVQGTVYAELLKMMHARQPGSIEHAVIQIPYIFSCHQGDTKDFECPDSLIKQDFKVCVDELRSKNYAGIALLIDEADCLGKNVPLIQTFRNIFQVVEHCSLLLAGTEAVFPTLSEVFSPIPRQFHRVNVNPFARWSDTLELVLRPLRSISNDDGITIYPALPVIQDLHELCGGSPDEVQLYCHHMYHSVENGLTEKMSLTPHVFHEVLREYRSNSTPNAGTVLNAIERLPDELLFESKWLSRRKLTPDENIRVEILYRELAAGKTLSMSEREAIDATIRDGYQKLFQLGITESDSSISLVGTPLTAGFWKSFVEAERGKRLIWSDNSLAGHFHKIIAIRIGIFCNTLPPMMVSTDGGAISLAIEALRAEKNLPDISDHFGDMVQAYWIAQKHKVTHAVDCVFDIESPAGKQTFQCRYLERVGSPLERVMIDQLITNGARLLAGNDIELTLRDFRKWELPSYADLLRLERITGNRVPPAAFAPSEEMIQAVVTLTKEINQAVAKFNEGDIQGCIDQLQKMLAERDAPDVRNSLAFFQILAGAVAEGLLNATKAVKDYYIPLYEMNKGIAEFLIGDKVAAEQSLNNALVQLCSPDTNFQTTAASVLVLDSTLDKVIPCDELPTDAAILINLWRMKVLNRSELEAKLSNIDADKWKSWIERFPEASSS